MKLFKEHQYLLMQRESRIVIGKRAANLWLLVLVLLATFFAIAFSEGSLTYLEDKMNDPFTNWVNIGRNGPGTELQELCSVLKQDTTHHYLFDQVQTESRNSILMISRTNKQELFTILYYEDMNSDFIRAILSPENVVNGMSIPCDSISNSSLGIVLTLDALRRLGYPDGSYVPAFVDRSMVCENGDSLGYQLIGEDGVRGPIPLIAVVKSLPMNMDAIAPENLLKYSEDRDDFPFSMKKETYVRNLYFFVPSNVNDFDEENIVPLIPDSLLGSLTIAEEQFLHERFQTWQEGHFMQVDVGWYNTPLPIINDIEKKICEKYGPNGVQRIYNYSVSKKDLDEYNDDVISVHFFRLDSIKSFKDFVKLKTNAKLQVEMTQVESRENFNAVSVLCKTVTAAMIVFAIICIIIFITNMLQNHFQKVRRNLGTFKAFGISTKELSWVYIAILVGIVLTALVIALAATWLVELILPVKEQEYSYLILWNSKTLVAIIIILASTILTVLFVMRRLLRHTPGDLIYDR